MALHPWSNNDSFLIQVTQSQSPEQISGFIQQLLRHRNLYSLQALNYCLIYSSGTGPCVLVQTLLEVGAHIETRDERGNTPLILSVANNQMNITRLLLSKGANVNALNKDGETALILSTYFSASHITTKVLLENQDINTELRNVYGFTALACAIQVHNLEAIKLMIDTKASLGRPACRYNIDFTFFSTLPTSVQDVSMSNGIFSLMKFFQIQADSGQPAISLAALQRDSRSVHYITSMDNTVLNYNSGTYLQALIKILESIKPLPISDENEINIVKMLTQTYASLRKHPVDKLLQDTAMELAVKIGHTFVIQLLCENEFEISNRVLGSVAESGNRLLLDMLVNHGAKVCEINLIGQQQYQGSALEKAIQNEQFECAKLLINCGAFLDIPLALKLSVESRKEKSLTFLFDEFLEDTKSTIMSSDLLHLAVSGGNINIINMLLDKGADVNRVHNEKIPLMEAVDFRVIDLLVSRGADVNMVIGSNRSFQLVLHYFVSDQYIFYLRSKFTDKDNSWINILHAALVKQLIRHGASVNGRDFLDRTPLIVAAETRDSCEVIKVLLEAGSDVNESREDGDTALHIALHSGHSENVKCLLQSGADATAVRDIDENVLFNSYDVELLKLLIESKANVNVEDSEGNNLLMHHLERWSVDEEIITALIDAKCDVNHTNKEDKTPLFLAAKRLEPDIVSQLLRSGADANYSVTKGDKVKSAVTILIKRLWNHASEAKECLEMLLNHGLNATTIPPCLIHSLISVGCNSLLTKFISLGLPPSELVIQRTILAWYKSKYTISPLVVALLMRNMEVAQYFIDIRFLTQKDLHLLSGHEEAKEYFRSELRHDCLGFFEKNCSQPLSLETLSFVAVSEVFGSGPGRTDSIKKSGLPEPLKEALLYKKVSHDLTDSFRTNLFLYKSSLQQAKLYPIIERYFDVMHEYDTEFDSDTEDD